MNEHKEPRPHSFSIRPNGIFILWPDDWCLPPEFLTEHGRGVGGVYYPDYCVFIHSIKFKDDTMWDCEKGFH